MAQAHKPVVQTGIGPKVLVVDDDAAVRDSIEALLAESMHVKACANAELALKVLEYWEADVVCADYGLPGITGLALLQRVAAAERATRGLLITGSQEYRRASEREGWFVLLKPFDPQRLLSLVQHLARIASMRRAIGNTKRRLGIKPNV